MVHEVTQPDAAASERHLARLTAAYPAFAFSHEEFGWKGSRWVAERNDRAAPGLGVVITADLMELHAALQRDKAASCAPAGSGLARSEGSGP